MVSDGTSIEKLYGDNTFHWSSVKKNVRRLPVENEVGIL
jgi:hypothetical protein